MKNLCDGLRMLRTPPSDWRVHSRNAHVRLYSTVELFTCFLNRWKCRFELILLSEFVPSFFEERGALCTEHSLFLSFIFCASFWSSEKDLIGKLTWSWLKYVHIQ